MSEVDVTAAPNIRSVMMPEALENRTGIDLALLLIIRLALLGMTSRAPGTPERRRSSRISRL
ncbi:MAG: hypothetical protein U0031_10625 [Thermomicrobiales bacterium]